MFQVASIRLFTKSKNRDYFTLISSPALDVFEIFMSVSVETNTKIIMFVLLDFWNLQNIQVSIIGFSYILSNQ